MATWETDTGNTTVRSLGGHDRLRTSPTDPSTTRNGHLGGLPSLAGLRFTPTQVLRYLLLLITLCLDITHGQDAGPRYKTTSRACRIDSQCNSDVGEVCWWFFDGCPRGTCMCDPTWSFLDTSGECRPLKFGGELCNARDKCIAGMSCKDNMCRCDRGAMTSDGRFCMSTTKRLLGDTCMPGVDTCHQRLFNGYSSSDTFCSARSVCRCREGLKERNGRCQRWNIGEVGCIMDFQCQGGALCIDGTCDCPSGYIPTAGNSKCAKLGAKYDLPIAAPCDEINENRYCAHDLVCHRCAANRDYTCVKFVPSQPSSGEYVSASAGLGPMTTIAAICVLLNRILVR